MSGKLEKLIITGYKDTKLQKMVSSYSVLINPDQIVVEKKVEFHKSDTSGKSSGQLRFKGVAPLKLNLKLLFDGTGIIQTPEFLAPVNVLAPDLPTSGLSEVNKQIQAFEKAAASYYGSEHKTLHLKITWGELIFKGVLESFKVTYTLFDSDGAPIRATGDAVFGGTVDVEERKKKENNQSPDMTHVRVVEEGDTLPLMCDRIYKDSSLYLEIARVNRLSNYRKLEVGSKLFFPPIKNEA